MSRIIYAIEQTTADMMTAEKKRFLKVLLDDGIITKEEYDILKGEVL